MGQNVERLKGQLEVMSNIINAAWDIMLNVKNVEWK